MIWQCAASFSGSTASRRRAVSRAASTSPRAATLRQPVQGAVELPAQDLALVILPIVEAEAVPQAETLQEIAAAEGDGITQRPRQSGQTPAAP